MRLRAPFQQRGGRSSSDASSIEDEVAVAALAIRYSLAALLALIVVAVATGFVGRPLATDEAIDDATRVTTIAARAAVEPAITDALLAMDEAAIARVDAVVRQHLLPRSILRVTIRSSNGTVVYSNEAQLIGRNFELDKKSLDALSEGRQGAPPYAVVSDASPPGSSNEGSTVKVLAVTVPIRTPSDTPLILEAYFRYEDVVRAGRHVWLRFALLTIGALLSLELLLLPLAIRMARRLRRSHERRESVLNNAINAANAERRRIASDLHDGVVQELAGVTFALAATSREMASSERQQVSRASEQVRDAVRSLRSLMVEIYPPNVHQEGLEAALTDLVAGLGIRGIEATLTIEAPVTELPVDIAQLVYRATQEGLRNVLSHADAKRVHVIIAEDGDRLTVRVIDDGRGFTDDQVRPHDDQLALRALTGFATSMGAEVTIDSDSDTGTELRLQVQVS